MGRWIASLTVAAAATALIPAATAIPTLVPRTAYAGALPTSSAQAGYGWDATAASLRGRNGQRFVFGCPAGGSPHRIWGTDLYTDDSSVCTAGVHTGTISLARGGSVTIEIRPGATAYTGSTRNGITSSSYGSWSGSFAVIGGSTSVCAAPKACIGGSGWNADTRHLRGRIGERFTFTCPAGGTPRTIWGTGLYTDDSSVCTAAVHAGKITLTRGGTVTVEVRAGQSSYSGTTRHGITSKSYGSWSGSFIVVGASGGGLAGSDWNADARHLRGHYGERFTYSCPAGGTPRAVWGSGVYTDDSSVCTAAVHRGRITLSRGGTVTIEIRHGQSSYAASTRNGITTRSYGAWSGSFVVI
jgi:hypothetical protein